MKDENALELNGEIDNNNHSSSSSGSNNNGIDDKIQNQSGLSNFLGLFDVHEDSTLLKRVRHTNPNEIYRTVLHCTVL